VTRPRSIVALTCALALAFPAAALAQGAGDDQYTDPFADQPAQSGGGSSGSSNSSGSSSGSSTTSGASSGTGGASSGSTSAASSGTPAPATATADPPASSELARTGGDALPTALAGAALLLGGVALRRRTADGAAR
jgi:hypothetical protein